MQVGPGLLWSSGFAILLMHEVMLAHLTADDSLCTPLALTRVWVVGSGKRYVMNCLSIIATNA